jgi:tetratricopeptide (TPR) repeat protein
MLIGMFRPGIRRVLLVALAMLLFPHGPAVASPSAAPPERTRALQARVRSNPLDALAHNELGVALAGSGDLVGARMHLWLAVLVNERLVDGWANLALAERKAKQHGVAIAAFGRALSLKADQHEVWYSAGASLRALKRDDESMFALRTFLEHAPQANRKRAKVTRILAKWHREGLKPAAPQWPEPTPPPALVRQIAAAIAAAAQPAAVTPAPKPPRAAPEPPIEARTPPPPLDTSEVAALPSHGGDVAFAGRRYVEALRNYESQAKQSPEDGVLFYKIGATRSILGDPTGALRAWRRVLRQAPERLILNRQIAYATRRLADWGMLETTRAPPEDLVGAIREALMAGDPADALLLTRGADDPETLLLRGEAALRLGQLDVALEAFEAGLALAPNDRDLRGGRIEVMVHLESPGAEESAQAWMDDMEATSAAFLAERALVVARRIQYGSTSGDSTDEFDEDLD